MGAEQRGVGFWGGHNHRRKDLALSRGRILPEVVAVSLGPTFCPLGGRELDLVQR